MAKSQDAHKEVKKAPKAAPEKKKDNVKKADTVVAGTGWREKANGSSTVLSCVCASAFQDKQYGVANRVHNIGGKKGGKKATCTVCEKVK